ncbi:MAG TPA: APC family permease [Candidatus Saccharimonadales bacterium]|nr:APC family permease [Candidatus Saccharimonadales bacterium]
MNNAKGPQLKRVVNTRMLALYGIGNIVGAGVYVLIGKIAEPAGYMALVAFLLAALVAFCAALSYAELASRFPVSAGVAVYLHEAFKAKRLSTVIGIMLVSAGVVSTATLLKGFAGYFYQLIAIPTWITMLVVALALIGIMLKGIKESVGAAALLTLLEVGGLIFLAVSILLVRPEALSAYSAGFSDAVSTIDWGMAAGIISAAFIAFYAFVGFEDMVNIAEEVKEPQKSFPRAILISVAVVTILYIVVAIVALGTLPPQTLGGSSAPLADVYHAATGNATTIIVIISLLATLNGVLVNVIMGSRFLYGMARRGWITEWFSKVSARHVPARGVTIVGVLALAAALWFPIERLAQLTSLLLLCVFAAVNLSLIVIRRRGGAAARSLQLSPTFIPWVGAIASISLLFAQMAVTIAALL